MHDDVRERLSVVIDLITADKTTNSHTINTQQIANQLQKLLLTCGESKAAFRCASPAQHQAAKQRVQ